MHVRVCTTIVLVYLSEFVRASVCVCVSACNIVCACACTCEYVNACAFACACECIGEEARSQRRLK